MIKTAKKTHIDMNKLHANFPAVDGIANGKFRQVKCYLPGTGGRQSAVQRIVTQAEDLEDKCSTAATRLLSNNAKLLRELLELDKKGTVMPSSFNALATKEIRRFDKDEEHEWNEDGLANKMLTNMVIVVPDDMVNDVKKELKAKNLGYMGVEGGGLTSTQVKGLMNETGYRAKKPRKVISDGDESDDEDFSL
jgi:hypothetical protein